MPAFAGLAIGWLLAEGGVPAVAVFIGAFEFHGIAKCTGDTRRNPGDR